MQQFQAHSSSRTVDWARFDGRTLEIDFKDSKGNKASTYSYDGTLLSNQTNPTAGFPYDVWNRFQAESPTEKARFFAYHIRPVFKGVKIWSKGR